MTSRRVEQTPRRRRDTTITDWIALAWSSRTRRDVSSSPPSSRSRRPDTAHRARCTPRDPSRRLLSRRARSRRLVPRRGARRPPTLARFARSEPSLRPAMPAPTTRRRPRSAPVVALVTTSGCPHCRRAKTALDAANVVAEIDASAPDGATDASRAASGTAPSPRCSSEAPSWRRGRPRGGPRLRRVRVSLRRRVARPDSPRRPTRARRPNRRGDRRSDRRQDRRRRHTGTAKTDAETRDRTAATFAADDSPDDTSDDSPDDSPDDLDFAARRAGHAHEPRTHATDRWTLGGWRREGKPCVWTAPPSSLARVAREGGHVRRGVGRPTRVRRRVGSRVDGRALARADSSHPLLTHPRRLYRLADHASSPRVPRSSRAPLNARRRWRGARATRRRRRPEALVAARRVILRR